MRSIFWLVMLLCTTLSAAPEFRTRLVVSASSLVEQDPFGPFYRSRLFKSDETAPFVIERADLYAFENDDAVFFADNGAQLTEDMIISADAKSEQQSLVPGALGHSYRCFNWSAKNDDTLRRYLGADTREVQQFTRKNKELQINAFLKEPKAKWQWPSDKKGLRKIPAIKVRDNQKQEHLVVARAVGSLTNRLALVDNLLKIDSPNTAGWIDMGTSHGEFKEASARQIEQVKRRQPLAIFAGPFEMLSLTKKKDLYNDLPLLYPFADHAHKSVRDNIDLWATAGQEASWPLLKALGARFSVQEAIKQMQSSIDVNKARRLNIVRAFSEDSARELAKSVYVDLVLLIASDPFAPLATKEFIELKHVRTDAYEQVAPIVSIGYLDVAEIKLNGPSRSVVQSVEITRHNIDDGRAQASDVPPSAYANDGIALPSIAMSWKKDELERVLGGLMRTKTKSDIAIFTELPHVAPIASAIPIDMGLSLLGEGGTIVSIETSGRIVKRINKLITSEKFAKKFRVIGIDPKTSRIGGRLINDNERFKLALNQDAWLQFHTLGMLGVLGENYIDRGPFVEAIYADLRQLFFVGGPKVIPTSDTSEELESAGQRLEPEINARALAKALPSLNIQTIDDYLSWPMGRPHQVLSLDITYLDIGLSKNFANKNYEDNMKKSPISRGNIPLYAHLFLYSKIALNHDAPFLQTSLWNEIKYMHTNLDEKPEKDKTKIGLKFRLPWERTLFKDKPIVVAPIWKNIYETKLAPHWFSDNNKLPKRTKRIDSLLGVNVDFTRLGFNVDLGGVAALDFNRTNMNDAFDYGPGLNFFSKWSLFGPIELSSDIGAYYYFPLPQNKVKDKLALHIEPTIWLRLARFYDFSVAIVDDSLITSTQGTSKLALSSILGLTISYGRLFRLFG